MPSRISLRAGRLSLGVSPSVGGSIASFDWIEGERKWPILRDGEDSADILGMASFPLVPFANRLRGSGFMFRGKRVPLIPNLPAEPSPIHGHGWQESWDSRQPDDRCVELRFKYDGGDWPWRYEVRQIIALDPAGVSLRLSCRNLSQRPMPCGLGQHPHFPCGAETRLHARVGRVWTTDRSHLPVKRLIPRGRYSLNKRLICSLDLNQCYCGWTGPAVISDPTWPFAIRMSSDASFLQVYSPSTGGFFAAEPVSHSVAALNEREEDWPELGLKVLQPGDETELIMRLEIFDRPCFNEACLGW